ncbi:MAG: hypothetical protein ACXVBE_03645 [Bdellovibrionota bacterium]
MTKFFALLGLALGLSYSAHARSFTDDPLRACRKITRESKIQNINLLIVGIEGTLQYHSDDADDLFSYAQARKSGPVDAELPTLGRWSGGILSKGLLFPLLRELGNQVDIVSFDLDLNRDMGDAETCARNWMRVPGHKLMIIGHSSGSQEALRLVNRLHEDRVPVDTLVTIDAIALMGALYRPHGVSHFYNFYQKVGHMRGQSVVGDIDLKVKDVQGHMTVTTSPTIFRYVSAQISAIVDL